MNEVPALLLIMGIWFGMVGLCFLAYRSGRKRHEELALHAPLHPESTVHRMDAALSQAEEGFNECSGCGFQNFKRSIFCQLCGETIDSPLRDPIESKKSKKGRGSSTTTALSSPRSEIVSVTNVARQHRAKKRREWVRELNSGGDFVWRREAQVEQDEPVALFPSYVLRFIPTDVITAGIDAVQIKIVDNKAAPESCALVTACDVTSDEEPEDVQEKPEHEQAEVKGPIRGTYDERVAEIKQMCESVRLELHDACIADAAVFPIAVESTLDPEQVGGDVKTFHERFQHDFPTKLASFVKTTTNIFVPPDKLHMKMHLDRETVVGDSMKLLGLIQQKDVRVAFRIDFVKEKAVDAGGVYREWFLLLNEGLVKKEKGIFRCVDQTEQTYYLNPNSAHDIGEDHLLYFLATGRLIGRSLLEGNATGFHLSLPLLKLILGLPLSFSDLEFFDPATYKNMKWLLENDGVEALCLDFTVTEQVDGTMVDVELIPNGGNIPVTDDNKLEYVDRLFRYRLFESVQPQLYAFLRGVYEVIPAELLMMFDPEELDLVLCGADEIDVDDWERNTKYTSDLYKHPCLKWFWEIVREMPNEYRRRLLQFATGSSRVPLSGFSTLTSYDGRLCPFTLKGVALSDEGYIHSHACFNRLDLPRHTDKEKLKVILYAILNTEQHGFTTS